MDLSWVISGLCACGGLLVVLFAGRGVLRLIPGRWRGWFTGGVILGMALVTVVVLDAAWSPNAERALVPSPAPQEAEFVSSNACRACHPKQYESWHQTYHRTMTQPARTETIVGAFDGRTLTSNYGATARVKRTGDEFWVELTDLDLLREASERQLVVQDLNKVPRVRRQVVMATGSHFFQVYWIRSQNQQEYLQFPWRWHIVEQRWIHGFDAFVMPEEDAVSSDQGNYRRIWNGDCTACHTLGPRPGFEAGSQRFVDTRVAELGISCESCHTPGKEHVRLQRDPWKRYVHHLGKEADASIVNPVQCDSKVSSEICGQCHSHTMPVDPRSRVTGRTYRAGQEFAKHLKMASPNGTAEAATQFWKDGTERAAGREFSGLAISACYLKGELSCSTCHSSHGGDRNHLITSEMLTNRACLPCHQEHVEKPAAHTHHAAESSGSLCYNCHMPHTSLGLMKAARSHRIDNPQVLPVSSEERPNACNLCHLDKSLGWTAKQLHEWYGTAVPKLTDEEERVAAGALWLLRGDAGQRAVAAWHTGWEPAQRVSGTDWMPPVLAPLLDDSYAAVRFIVNQSARRLPGLSEWKNEFDGPPAQRKESRGRMSEWWLKSGGRVTSRKGLESLFDREGKLRPEEVEKVWRRRDQHAVRVEE